ncbi:hypothetical protein [Chrysiogenes arsenatis]|uniref:hypothetical protein n=1 Tax=Chrysiogenes arsenatis TaxID=309797 RepID=UPI0004220285|nr:hypothetical protein [Chrysiogenes arsenatis]
MPSAPMQCIATRPLALPDGSIVAEGQVVSLSPRQAKYWLLAGKVRPAGQAAKPQGGKEKPAASAKE